MKKRIGAMAACFILIISLLPLTVFANELPPEVSDAQGIVASEEIAKSEAPAALEEESSEEESDSDRKEEAKEAVPEEVASAEEEVSTTPAEQAIDETLVPEPASEEAAESEAVTEDSSTQDSEEASAQEETLPENSESGRSMHTQGGAPGPYVDNDKVDPLLTSLTINDIELIEESQGNYLRNHDPETGAISPSYYNYDVKYASSLWITMVYNGKQYSGDYIYIFNVLKELKGLYCYPDFITDQSYDTQWVPGNTYPVTVKIMGRTAQFNVTIKESLLTYMSLEDVEIYEDSGVQVINNDPVPPFKKYYTEMNYTQRMTIVYDGQEYSGTGREIGNILEELTGAWAWPWCFDDQSYYNQWKGGNTYKVTAKLLGLETEYNFTIKKYPITSLKINDIKLTEGTHGSHQGSFYQYTLDDAVLSIVYNGQRYTGTESQISYQLTGQTEQRPRIVFYDRPSAINPWKAGNTYTVRASFMGRETTFKVTIEKNKLTDFKVNDMFIMENTNGYSFGGVYFYNTLPDSASITYNGKKYTGSIGDVYTKLYNDTGIKATYGPITYQDQLQAGKTYTATAYFMNKSCTYKVTILPAKVAISKTKASLSKTSYTFNGKALTPAVTVKYGSSTLVKGRDYTVKYTANKNAGTATVAITGKGSFAGTVKKTFKIAKAANTITKVTASKTLKKASLAKKAQAFKIAATAKGSAKKSFAMLKSTSAKAKKYIKVSSAGKVTVKKGTPKGTYNIKVKITAKATANYKAKSLTKTIKIVVK